ncbi:MAG: ACT domain-containing protein [Ruminiclostridium sp.]
MTEITIIENVSVVTFKNQSDSDGNEFLAEIFKKTAEAGISVDMISQAPATSETVSFGFTFADEALTTILPIINAVSKGRTMPMVNCGNVKFIIKAAEMENSVGFAAKAFAALSSADCSPVLVSTGVDEISILVAPSDSAELEKQLKKVF